MYKKMCWKAGALMLLLLLSILLFYPVGAMAVEADKNAAENSIGVEYRGHVENYGNMPKPEGTFVSGPEALGTRGQSLRVEGFWIELTGDVPEGASICYQVHVENEGWMEPVKDGVFAGTQGRGLRVESIKIWLEGLDGYDVYYHGHVQNVGNIPMDKDEWGWVKDGAEMGTTGSGLRLEELEVKIVKKGADLTAYNALLDQIVALKEADYTTYSWNHLQTALSDNQMTDQNEQAQVDQAVVNIQAALDLLENIPNAIVYNEAGVYGPNSAVETIDQDVIVMADGVTLQNMKLNGNLIVTEDVGDGDVTLNNISVEGDTRFRGGGIHSIHINGGQYKNIIVQKLATGELRIVTTDAYDENGMPLVIAQDAVDDTVIIEGRFDSVEINAPGARVIMQGDDTSVGSMKVTEEAEGSEVTVGAGTEIGDLDIDATSQVKGEGAVKNADVNADGVVFEKRPDKWEEKDNLDVPPVMPDEPGPTPGSGGGGYVSPKQSGAPKFNMVGPYEPGNVVGVGPGSLATQTNLAYTWYASEDKKYDEGTDTEIGTGGNYTVGVSDLGKYLIVIATTPDIAGSGMVVSDDVVIAGQISNVSIGTAAPVTGSNIDDGTNTVEHAGAPVVTWSVDNGNNWAEKCGIFSAPIAYQTKYVYTANENYRFDSGFDSDDITVTGASDKSVTVSENKRQLTIIVTWPSTIATIDKAVTLNTQAPVTGSLMEAGTNKIDHASDPVVKWSADNGNNFTAAGAEDKFEGPIAYQTQYVYTAADNYQFNSAISVSDITVTGYSGKSVAVSDDKSQLTITVTWLSTFGILNSVTIDTPAPAAGKASSDSVTNTITNASLQSVSWSTDGSDFTGNFGVGEIYQTQYVYVANSPYQFDSSMTASDITVENGGTVSEVVVSNQMGTNNKLTITVTWPAALELIDKAVTIGTSAPVLGGTPATTTMGDNKIDHASDPTIRWFKKNGSDYEEIGENTNFELGESYRTEYVYLANTNYRFDSAITTGDVTVTGGNVASAKVYDYKQTLIITVDWPKIVATIDTSGVILNTPAPVTGNEMADGSNTLTHAGSPVVTWSVKNGESWDAVADSVTSFEGPKVYQSQYVYTADENYKFDDSIPTSNITVSNGGTVSSVVVSDDKSQLTITVTWPSTIGSLDSVTINTPAPVTGNEMADGDNRLDPGATWSVEWSADSGTNWAAASGKFAGEIAYQSKYVYTAADHYQFGTIEDSDISVVKDGSPVTGVTVAQGLSADKSKLTVTVTWPETAAALVSDLDLSSLVTAPVAGGSPDTTAIAAAQYTSTAISWTKDDGTAVAVGDTFAASCVYKAEVSLTAKSGYTFDGLAENSFSYTGATSVTNDAATDTSLTVTITFPATEAPEPDTFTLKKATCTGVSTSASWGAFSEDALSGEEHKPTDGYQIFGIMNYGGKVPLVVNSSGHIQYWSSGDSNWGDFGNNNTSYTPVGGNSSGSIWTYDSSSGQSYWGGTDYYTQGAGTYYYTNFYNETSAGMPLLGSCSASLDSDGSGGYMTSTYFVFLDNKNDQLVLANTDINFGGTEFVRIPAPSIPGGYKICGFDTDEDDTGATTTITCYICNASQAYQR